MTNTDSDNFESGCTSLCTLKKRQEDQKQELKKQEDQKQELKKQEDQKQELKKQEDQKQELKKQEDQKQELIDIANKENISIPPKTIIEPKLGEFDDNFTGRQWY